MTEPLHALIVDDEPDVRQLTVRALKSYSFSCDEAPDGEQAWEMIGRREYQVVITDLRMPKRNGHSLAIELAARGADRPLIVVLTGVLEPRLATDLIQRGVDDITFKPVDFKAFGAKVKALCERRQQATQSASSTRAQPVFGPQVHSAGSPPISAQEIERRLDVLAKNLRISPAAIEAAQLVEKGKPSKSDLSRIIDRDPSLRDGMARVVHNTCCDPRGKQGTNTEQLISRLTPRAISETAVASAVLDAIADSPAAWLDAKLLGHRSIATTMAVQHLPVVAGPAADEDGLLLSSLLLPMSRLLFATVVPDIYEHHIAECRKAGLSLAAVERKHFPLSPAAALAGILERWKLPSRLHQPLKHAGLRYEEIAKLADPHRAKVERLRTAELFGQLSVGRFEDWDELDFPTPEIMRRLRGDNVGMIIQQIRAAMCDQLSQETTSIIQPSARASECGVRYFKLSDEPYDFLTLALEALHRKLINVPRPVACKPEPCIVNCLDVSDEHWKWFAEDAAPTKSRTLVCRSQRGSGGERYGKLLQLPASWKSFSEAICH